jgi:hypothetical protein
LEFLYIRLFCVFHAVLHFPFTSSILRQPRHLSVEFPYCMLSGVDLISRIARDLLLFILFSCAAFIQVRYRCFNYCIYSKGTFDLPIVIALLLCWIYSIVMVGLLAQHNVNVHVNHKAIREMAAEWR